MQENNETATPLSKGNAALRKGNYTQAIAHYAQVIVQQPGLAKSISANLTIARNKYRASRQDNAKSSVAVCGWELAHNAAGRVFTLATIYETFAHVEIIGCLFPKYGREIWEPIRDTQIAKHSFVVEEESKFIEQAIQLVAAHPYDIVHLSKPRAPNIFFGILYKQLWGAKVLMDIDDEELALVGAESPISVDEYHKQWGMLPELKNLAGKDWTQLAVGLANKFDGITVCNSALQARYGGEIIRHARDGNLFNTSPEFKRKSRETYCIALDKKIVLFLGTPRQHKGLIETAKAVAALKRDDIQFVIVGDFPDKSIKAELQKINGCDLLFLGNKPFNEIPHVVAVADCSVILQDPLSRVAQIQTPAKLSDALASGIQVLASVTQGMEDVIDGMAIQAIAGSLEDKLRACLSDSDIKTRSAKARALFDAKFSIPPNVAALRKTLENSRQSHLSSNLQKLISRYGILISNFHLASNQSEMIESDLRRGGLDTPTQGLPAKLNLTQIPDWVLHAQVSSYLKKTRKRVHAPKVVVYTAVSNNYDIPKIPERLCDDWDYVCFTDRDEYPGELPWKFCNFDYLFDDSTRTARFAKTHPHLYFSEYEYSIWVDAHILIKDDFLERVLDRMLTNGMHFGAIPHPWRSCTYEEAKTCTEESKDNGEVIAAQMAAYKKDGFPNGFGLIESQILIRKHNDPKISALNDSWWKEIDTHSKRDQLSLMYVLWKQECEWFPIMVGKGVSTRNHGSFSFFQHGLKSTSRDPGYQVPAFLPNKFLVDQMPFWVNYRRKFKSDILMNLSHRSIDIVVCVHNALEDVTTCLSSVLRNVLPSHRIIVIDDGSDIATKNYLESISGNPCVRLIRNDSALGYTKSANLGLRASTAEFVILLNSDTIVSAMWAVKLLEVAVSAKNIGVVGPLSNAASWQSVPYLRDPATGGMAVNALPETIGLGGINRLCEEYGYFRKFPRVPLVNGFCYGIRREVIERIGFLDEVAFPRGYGEEDDYSFRAQNVGFTHAIATHCYVYHAKSKSFGSEARKVLAEAGGRVLRERHGHARVERATKVMRSNPFLVAMRCQLGGAMGVQVPDRMVEQLPMPAGLDIAEIINNQDRQITEQPDWSVRSAENSEAYPLELKLCQLSLKELKDNEKFSRQSFPNIDKLRTAIWFLPSFRNILAGGIRTIFATAEMFSKYWGTINYIVVLQTGGNRIQLDSEIIKTHFPNLHFKVLHMVPGDPMDFLPQADAGFCTSWPTAYALARYNAVGMKFYFMQDYESLFYPAGSLQALIDQTYRFGFFCIANSAGIAEQYKRFSDRLHYFTPGVDAAFSPQTRKSESNNFQVVFYGRPSNSRNAFALGAEALRIVKKHLGDKVRILSVGAEWKPEKYGLAGVIENLGVLKTMEDVAQLYRDSHVGLVFMLTPHPSYQPLEYMASGCATVSNINSGTEWLLRDSYNSILASPVPADVADKIISLLVDNELRDRVIRGGFETVRNMNWDCAFEEIRKFVCNPNGVVRFGLK